MKKLFKILFCSTFILSITACKEKVSELNLDVTLDDLIYEGRIFSINKVKKCVPVELVVYEGGKYILYTAHKSCRPFENCTMMLEYSKEIEGTYDYDVLKIIQASVDADDKSYDMSNLPEYEIMSGKGRRYVIEKGTVNKYLDEFLEQIDVNLNKCSNPDYR